MYACETRPGHQPHRAHLCHGKDADYVVWESWCGHWIEHMRWMIPGTQLEA